MLLFAYADIIRRFFYTGSALCRGGESGRRIRVKIGWGQLGAGSIPVIGTMIKTRCYLLFGMVFFD